MRWRTAARCRPATDSWFQITSPLVSRPAQAFEYQLQHAVTEAAQVDTHLAQLASQRSYGPEAHCEVGVLWLLKEA